VSLTIEPGVNVIKQVMSIIYEFLFVHAKVSKPVLTNTLAYYENSEITDPKVL
jgi:hypothetical protein